MIRLILDRHALKPIRHHCSGHAGIEDVKRLVSAMKPAEVVPIHTFGGGGFEEVLGEMATIQLHSDGECWEV